MNLKGRLKDFTKSPLYMNAIYLMLSALVLAVSGLLFWMVITRAYDVAAVGLATTLISVSGLISLLGLAGLDTSLVRFLPGSKDKNNHINNGYIVVAGLSAVLAVAFGVVLPMAVPGLSVLADPFVFVCFVFFTVVGSLSVLTSAVFLALKKVRHIFIINALFGIFKILLALEVAEGSAVTIFVVFGASQLVGLALGIAWMWRRLGYRFSPNIHTGTLDIVKKFSFSVYASSILNLLPPTILPLIIVHFIGPENAAYYYMAFTIAGALYTIAYASMQSMFAEGSHDQAAMRTHVLKAARLIFWLLLPAAILTAVLSNLLLGIFGQDYASNASGLLMLFALGALPVAVYSAMGAIFKVTKNLRAVVCMNLVYALVILGLSYVLVPTMGLLAVGWTWLIGNLAACAVGTVFLISNNNKL